MPCSHALKRIIIFALFFLLTFATQTFADYPHCETISQGLQRLLSKRNHAVQIGIVVQSLNTGRVYFSQNANQYFEPASVQKLFTVSSALINLKPGYRFPTRLFATGDITQGTLEGDLIVQFNGDPTLTKTNLNELIHQLQAMGVH